MRSALRRGSIAGVISESGDLERTMQQNGMDGCDRDTMDAIAVPPMNRTKGANERVPGETK